MSKRALFGIALVVLILGSYGVYVLLVSPPDSYPAIHIRPDGSVDPSSAPIQRNGNLYKFVDNIDMEIIVEKNDIVIDGNGFKLDILIHRSRGGSLWELSNVNNVSIRHMNVGPQCILILDNSHFCKVLDTNFTSIRLLSSNGNLISENFYIETIILSDSVNNTISLNAVGEVGLENSFNNRILNNRMVYLSSAAIDIQDSGSNLFFGNLISRPCQVWIKLFGNSSDNIIVGNNVTGPFVIDAIITCSGTNLFYHNNFVDVSWNQTVTLNNPSLWDNGVEGNYWSNYDGKDANADGVGDTPYIIDANNQDKYPLMKPINTEFEPEPQLPP